MPTDNKIDHEGIRLEFEKFLALLGELKITPVEYDRISGAVYDLLVHCTAAFNGEEK